MSRTEDRVEGEKMEGLVQQQVVSSVLFIVVEIIYVISSIS